MKLAPSFMLLFIVVLSNPLSATEFVRGGDLDILTEYLLHIEGHHENLEMIEDKMNTLKANKKPIYDTEVIMEKAVKWDDIDNAWKDNDPSWQQ